MHILTKVFVVLATVLAIAFSALAVAYAVNTDRVAADYNRVLAQNAALSAKTANVNGQAASLETRLRAAVQNAEDAKTAAEARNRTLEQEKASLLIAKNKAEASLQSIESKIAELGETARTQANLISNYRQENSTLQKNELSYRQRGLDMEQRLADVQSQLEVYSQQNRALQEQIVELQRQASLAASTGATGAAGVIGDQPFAYNGPRIQGQVQEVQRDAASGNQLARVSVGSNDRVAKNMKFMVVRGNEFVCNLVIQQVDMKWSVGVVQDLGKPVDVRAGDLIMSRAE